MIRAWLLQHGFIFFLTIKQLISTPIASLLSVTVMGIAISLPASIHLFMKNLQSISGQTLSSPQMSLFLKLGAEKEDVERIKQYLEKDSKIVSFQFVSKDVALHQMQQNSGLMDINASLPRNPLPDAFIVNVKKDKPRNLEQLRVAMQEWPKVEYVQFDSTWAERLNALLNLGRYVALMLAILLSIAIIAIMFNTIRLQILTKRDEIEISKLIGGTDNFIQRPFLYLGAVQGLVGGIVAWFIIVFIVETINRKLIVLTHFYQTELQLKHLSSEDGISVLLFSSLLGWLGARLSVASHLWQIEPR